MPPIKDNIAEGLILKPVKTLYFPNHQRVILKNKSLKFREKIEVKSKIMKKTIKTISKSSETGTKSAQVERFVQEVLSLLNQNRLDSVISKIGKVKSTDEGKLIGLLAKDAIEEFRRNFNEEFEENLKDEEKKVVTALFAKQAKIIVQRYFQNLRSNNE